LHSREKKFTLSARLPYGQAVEGTPFIRPVSETLIQKNQPLFRYRRFEKLSVRIDWSKTSEPINYAFELTFFLKSISNSKVEKIGDMAVRF